MNPNVRYDAEKKSEAREIMGMESHSLYVWKYFV